jgi:threonine/homoserine/homoserine lactone efflux protein
MKSQAIALYAAAVALTVATPGPAMITVISRGLAKGSGPALAIATGITFGDVLLGSLVLAGLATVLAIHAWLFAVIKLTGAAYLIWLGVKFWRTIPLSQVAEPSDRGNFFLGLAIALSNPKAILFHASLMPLLIDLRNLDGRAAVAILLVLFTGNMVVMSGYALLAGRGRNWLKSTDHFRWLNRTAGGLMIGTGLAIATA